MWVEAPATIRMRSGFRQGCLASVSVFALATDPVLQGVVSSSPSLRSRLVASLDDVASRLHRLLIMVQEMVRQLADMARALRRCGLCTEPTSEKDRTPVTYENIATVTSEGQTVDS